MILKASIFVIGLLARSVLLGKIFDAHKLCCKSVKGGYEGEAGGKLCKKEMVKTNVVNLTVNLRHVFCEKKKSEL